MSAPAELSKLPKTFEEMYVKINVSGFVKKLASGSLLLCSFCPWFDIKYQCVSNYFKLQVYAVLILNYHVTGCFLRITYQQSLL